MEPYSLQKVFDRIESKPLIKDEPIFNITKEIDKFKVEIDNLKWRISRLETNNNAITNKDEIRGLLSLDNNINQKWYINTKLIIQDFVLETIALIDSGSDLNCIRQDLIPSNYFEKVHYALNTANSSPMEINNKLSDVLICNDMIRIKTHFALSKNLSQMVILGKPFLSLIWPIERVDDEGIHTILMGKKIIFEFIIKPDKDYLHQLKEEMVFEIDNEPSSGNTTI